MITIEVENGQVQAALRGLTAALYDMTPVMGRIADILRDNAEDRFAAQTAPDGSPWAPRSPVTILRYLASGEGFGGILHRTGRMRQTLGTDFGRDFAEVSSAAVQSAAMQFGMARGYAGTHEGTDRNGRKFRVQTPWGNIPARPFLGISDKDEADILALVARYMDDASAP